MYRLTPVALLHVLVRCSLLKAFTFTCFQRGIVNFFNMALNRILVACLLNVLVFIQTAQAQVPDEERTYKDAKVLKEKSVLLRTGDDVMLSVYDQSPQFPNIHALPYFYDKKQFTEIKKFESKGDVDNLEKVLLPYIDKFGVEKFPERPRPHLARWQGYADSERHA